MTSRPLSPLAIFDLDGTLVDTAADLVSSLNHTIAAAGLAPVTYDDLTHLVGQGARVMIKRAFALRETELPEAEIEPLYERFITHYRAEMPGESRPYPGIVGVLDALSAAGITLAVCTNKTEILALPLLEARLDPIFRRHHLRRHLFLPQAGCPPYSRHHRKGRRR